MQIKSVRAHQAKNHANKSKKPMKEIIDMLTFGEWFLIRFRMAYLEAIADLRQFFGLPLQ